jgi:hypothetical protein
MATNPPGPGHERVNPEPSRPEGHGHGHGESDIVLAGPTHDLAYEPDEFAVRTILTVPAAVIGTAFVAFVITWIVFAYVFDPRKNNPEPEMQTAADRNAAPLDERFGRISSTDPNAEVQQPRLEGLDRRQVYAQDGDANNKDLGNLITSEMITTQPTREGNSPRVHAEDLMPSKVRELSTFGQDKNGTVRMPVDQAIKMAVGGGLLPAQPGARPLDIDPDWDRPKDSNAGHGKIPASSNPAPSAKKGADDKKDEKKDDKKDPEKT